MHSKTKSLCISDIFCCSTKRKKPSNRVVDYKLQLQDTTQSSPLKQVKQGFEVSQLSMRRNSIIIQCEDEEREQEVQDLKAITELILAKGYQPIGNNQAKANLRPIKESSYEVEGLHLISDNLLISCSSSGGSYQNKRFNGVNEDINYYQDTTKRDSMIMGESPALTHRNKEVLIQNEHLEFLKIEESNTQQQQLSESVSNTLIKTERVQISKRDSMPKEECLLHFQTQGIEHRQSLIQSDDKSQKEVDLSSLNYSISQNSKKQQLNLTRIESLSKKHLSDLCSQGLKMPYLHKMINSKRTTKLTNTVDEEIVLTQNNEENNNSISVTY